MTTTESPARYAIRTTKIHDDMSRETLAYTGSLRLETPDGSFREVARVSNTGGGESDRIDWHDRSDRDAFEEEAERAFPNEPRGWAVEKMMGVLMDEAILADAGLTYYAAVRDPKTNEVCLVLVRMENHRPIQEPIEKVPASRRIAEGEDWAAALNDANAPLFA